MKLQKFLIINCNLLFSNIIKTENIFNIKKIIFLKLLMLIIIFIV